MESKTKRASHFLPLRPLDFQVLTILAGRQLHGYGIVQAAQEQFPEQPSLEIGSLYRIVSRMLVDGLIREIPPLETIPKDRRVRRYYTATELGVHVIRAEAKRLRALLASPATVDVLGSDP